MYKQHKLGQAGEDFAYQYLKKQGLKLMARNFKCRLGEIDLIMQDQACLVFIEVRMRNNKHYGNAEESVTFYKQTRIIRAAQYYLQQYQSDPDCRFDVVALSRHNNGYDLQWYKDAFDTREF